MTALIEFILLFPQTIMKLITALFIMIAMTLYIGQFVYTQILLKIAILMAPIMVPFIMLEKTRFLFEGWLKFLITAGMVQIVGSVLFALMYGNVQEAVKIAEEIALKGASGNPVVPYTSYAMLMLLTALAAYIMTQTQQIGNSLVSGFVQGGFRFSPVAAAAPIARSAAAGAGVIANRVAGATVGAVKGAYNAPKGKAASGGFKGAMDGLKNGVVNSKAASTAKTATTSTPATSTPSAAPKQAQDLRAKISSTKSQT